MTKLLNRPSQLYKRATDDAKIWDEVKYRFTLITHYLMQLKKMSIDPTNLDSMYLLCRNVIQNDNFRHPKILFLMYFHYRLLNVLYRFSANICFSFELAKNIYPLCKK